MTLVDTSVWIEFLRQKDKSIDTGITGLIEMEVAVGISPVFGELLQGVKSESEAKIVLDLWENLPGIDESQLFIKAGKISYTNKLFQKGLGLIDCAILAASKENNLYLWTLDEKLIESAEKIGIQTTRF